MPDEAKYGDHEYERQRDEDLKKYKITEKPEQVKNIIGMFSDVCIVCKKKKCYYAFVSEENKQNEIQLICICSAKCQEEFKKSITGNGFYQSGENKIVVNCYDKIKIPSK